MKKIISFLYVPFLILCLSSCSKNSESQLYVIDSLKLGTTMKDFEIQMAKKINFSKKPGRSFNTLSFVSKQYLHQNERPYYLGSAYYTTTFNDNDNLDYTDYGLIIPINSSTKTNVVGVDVIFGRTINSVNLETFGSITNLVDEPIPYFAQTNRPEYLQKIRTLLITKYGEPTKIISKQSVPFYAFAGNQYGGYMTDINNTGNLLIWDNEVVKVTFFEGIDNYNVTYNPLEDTYFFAIDEDRNKSKKLESGFEITKGFSYLRYELKDDYMKKNKLNEPNL